MRIATVNVRRSADAKRLQRLWEALTPLQCDVIVLSEFRANEAGLGLQAQLVREGFVHCALSIPPPAKGVGIMIAARHAFDATRDPLRLNECFGAALCARFDELTVYGIYAPQGTPARVGLFDSLAEKARAHNAAHDAVMAIGDFNAGDDALDIERNRVGQKKKRPQFTADGRFGDLCEVWTDAWRLLHPDGSEYSWYSWERSKGTFNGWRIDHALISPALLPRLRSAHYVHETRIAGLTDHSALVISLSD